MRRRGGAWPVVLRRARGPLGAMALAVAACGAEDPTASGETPPPLPVEVLRAQPEPGYALQELFAGRVVARRESELGFERGGRLVRVLVEEGDAVEPGQPLAELEQRVLRARERELVARSAEIDARLALARLTAERRGRLRESDHVSAQRHDEAVAEQRALEAQRRAARAALDAVRAELALSTLQAPYPGRVTARLADEGSVLAPGATLLRVIEDGAMEFRVGLPPESASRLDETAEHEVTVGSTTFPVRLATRVPSVEPDTRTVTAVFAFAAPPDGVRHGALGRLALRSPIEASGFWLPLDALAESRRGLWSAYAVVPDGDAGLRVERRELQVLHTEAARAFVRGTVRPGETIVATGVHRLVPGQRVRVLE